MIPFEFQIYDEVSSCHVLLEVVEHILALLMVMKDIFVLAFLDWFGAEDVTFVTFLEQRLVKETKFDFWNSNSFKDFYSNFRMD